MKKVLVVLLILALVLSGCAFGGAGAQQPQPSEDAAPSVQEQPEATKPTPVPEESQEPSEDPTEPPSEAPEDPTEPESFLQQVKWAGFMIFSEPTYDGTPVQPIPVGTYTIVDMAQDDEGLDWGKLKSGLGWICLTEMDLFNGPASIGEADAELAMQDEFCYPKDITDYNIPIVIHACEDLTDLAIYICELGETEMEATELLFDKAELKKDDCLVVRLGFPGDFSCYHVCFRDEAGTELVFQISVSGRNGTIEAWNVTE